MRILLAEHRKLATDLVRAQPVACWWWNWGGDVVTTKGA